MARVRLSVPRRCTSSTRASSRTIAIATVRVCGAPRSTCHGLSHRTISAWRRPRLQRTSRAPVAVPSPTRLSSSSCISLFGDPVPGIACQAATVAQRFQVGGHQAMCCSRRSSLQQACGPARPVWSPTSTSLSAYPVCRGVHWLRLESALDLRWRCIVCASGPALTRRHEDATPYIHPPRSIESRAT